MARPRKKLDTHGQGPEVLRLIKKTPAGWKRERLPNPLYPRPSGGAGAEGLKKGILISWCGEEAVWEAPELDFGDGRVLVLDAGDPFPVDDLPVFAHH
jgi:hypothetical protein